MERKRQDEIFKEKRKNEIEIVVQKPSAHVSRQCCTVCNNVKHDFKCMQMGRGPHSHHRLYAFVPGTPCWQYFSSWPIQLFNVLHEQQQSVRDAPHRRRPEFTIDSNRLARWLFTPHFMITDLIIIILWVIRINYRQPHRCCNIRRRR